MYYIGVDIGGTKCAITVGDAACQVLEKTAFPTETEKGPEYALGRMEKEIARFLEKYRDVGGIGISCGGPLDGEKGLILSPPNLPGWDELPIIERFEKQFHVPVRLCNDADACAVAEWKFGAGCGCRNMIFLTFGTGMGAGLILGGKLYTGACNMAGEIGHVRIAEGGHTGYGKAGSFEGYCSGGGIAQYGKGSAKELAQRAAEGDAEACALFREVGTNLGRGLAILIDLLNPEAIVIGSIFTRCQKLLEPSMYEVLKREVLPQSLSAVKILPAGLGESIGDIAALSVAMGGF